MRLRLENKGLLRTMRSVPRLWQRCTLDRNIGEAGILVMSQTKIEWKIIIFVIADDLLKVETCLSLIMGRACIEIV